MKQLENRNILPFYGVSMTVADLCLVFPWYENGNIMEYLKGKPDVSRFALVGDFEKVPYYRHLLALANSYAVRAADCAFCTKTAWFMAP